MDVKLSLNSGQRQQHITRNAIYSLARCCSDRQIMKGIGHWWWLKPAAVEWNTLINIHNITWLESVTGEGGGGKWCKEQLLIKHPNTISLWTAGESLLQIIISLIIDIWISITAALWGPVLWQPEEQNEMAVIFISERTQTVHPLPGWCLK